MLEARSKERYMKKKNTTQVLTIMIKNVMCGHCFFNKSILFKDKSK